MKAATDDAVLTSRPSSVGFSRVAPSPLDLVREFCGRPALLRACGVRSFVLRHGRDCVPS